MQYSDFSFLTSLILTNKYNCVYIRYVHNSSPFFLIFLRKIKKIKNFKILLEIPTYPYDGEYKNLGLLSFMKFKIEKISRNFLYKYVDYIVTFSSHYNIFRIPTINISNGINFNDVKMINFLEQKESFTLIGVASLALWHGFDRLIKGIANYNKKSPTVNIRFFIVGNGDRQILASYKKLIVDLGLTDHVFLLGPQFGEKLDSLFSQSNIAVGCLSCHRKGIVEVKSLKNVEYAARGIPFFYSEKNNDFDVLPFVFKVPADDTDIDLEYILKEYNKIVKKNITSIDIRNSVINKLSWDIQMGKILQVISENKNE